MSAESLGASAVDGGSMDFIDAYLREFEQVVPSLSRDEVRAVADALMEA